MAASGYSPISLYYSTTASATPTNTNLVNGELALNITDGKLFYKDNAGTVQTLATKAATSGSFSTTTISTSETLSYGTANGVAYLNGSKVVTTGSALTFDGTNLGVGTASPASILNASFSGGAVSGTHSMAFGYPYAANLQLKSTNAGTSVAVASVGLYSNPERTREFAFFNQADDSKSGYFGYYYGSGSAIVDLKLFNSLNGALIFGANNSEQMRLTSTGLGIGTSSPGTKLHVTGSNGLFVQFLNSANNTGEGLVFGSGSNLGRMSTNGANTAMAFEINAVERMRLDSSGNLGLGVTPSGWQSDSRALDIGAYTSFSNVLGYQAVVANNAYYNSGYKYRTSGYVASAFVQASGGFSWLTTSTSGTAGNAITFTQAMTLDASGNLLVNTTSNNVAGRTSAKLNVAAGSNDTVQLKGVSTSYLNIASWIPVNAPGSGNAYHIGFGDGTSSYTERGVISTNGTGTTYGTNSDYRLKENVQPMTGALNKVAALKPVTYKWKSDNSDGEGFIAHELAEVCPHAVVGEKDGVKEDGSPRYQNIDTSFLVATLTAAIQEMKAIIDDQAARIAALEAK